MAGNEIRQVAELRDEGGTGSIPETTEVPVEKPHRDLDVWQVAMNLVELIYTTTERFPDSEKYGLVSQTRRSAISVPSNVSEGAARPSNDEFARYVDHARSSLSELDTQVEIARRLEYLDADTFSKIEKQLVRTDRLLAGLLRHLRDA